MVKLFDGRLEKWAESSLKERCLCNFNPHDKMNAILYHLFPPSSSTLEQKNYDARGFWYFEIRLSGTWWKNSHNSWKFVNIFGNRLIRLSSSLFFFFLFSLQLFREVRIMKILDHPNIGNLSSMILNCMSFWCHFSLLYFPPVLRFSKLQWNYSKW